MRRGKGELSTEMAESEIGNKESWLYGIDKGPEGATMAFGHGCRQGPGGGVNGHGATPQIRHYADPVNWPRRRDPPGRGSGGGCDGWHTLSAAR